MEGPGEIGTSGLELTGHFFVGAEGSVIGTTGSRRLELKTVSSPVDVNHLVYQRVGVAQNRAHTAEITATVTVPDGDEARISLTEADGTYYLLPWITRPPGGNFFADDPEGNDPSARRWFCYEFDPGVFGAAKPERLMPWLQPNPLCPGGKCPTGSGEETPLAWPIHESVAWEPSSESRGVFWAPMEGFLWFGTSRRCARRTSRP